MHPIVRRIAVLLLAGLPTVMLPICPASTQTPPTPHLPRVDPYADHVAEASQRFGIPAAWIRAVMHAESAGDPRAVSRKGAIGLMQIMPTTWAVLRVRHRLGADPYDPHDNILAGAAFLRELHDRYGSVAAMLAAYNAGPGRYEASLSGRPLPDETREYVAAIRPSLDGSITVPQIRVAAADPLAWTRAPLFIAQPDRMPVVDSTPAQGPLNDKPPALAPRDVPEIAVQSGGLFIARPDGRDPR